MRPKHGLSSPGYSLVELIVASLFGVLFLVAAGALFRPAVDISYLLTQQAGVQQAARLAVNVITRELRMAGNGIPAGGIQLPSGTSSQPSKFACDPTGCYVSNNTYAADRLYGVTPGDAKGTTVNGIVTDVITIAYRDPNSNLDQYPLLDIKSDGDKITFDAQTTPPYDDPDVGAEVGDVLLLCNVNGCAAGVVTKVRGKGKVDLKKKDPLDFNQPRAAYGNIASIINPPAATRAFRLLVVTYFIDNSNVDLPRLMRQVNALSPQVAALYVENLQLSYDIFDENSSSVTSNLPAAGGTPNQIRKINISIGARAPAEGLFGRGYERITLTTSVSTRNLRFRTLY
ncbi:hypothetical protein MYX75_05605 [Acidobacteria bacterium AH-259-A15]|nr:hypothetical protein [Acidobacteria bacterium AH-259-A15]